jgi:hypothetical protein
LRFGSGSLDALLSSASAGSTHVSQRMVREAEKTAPSAKTAGVGSSLDERLRRRPRALKIRKA